MAIVLNSVTNILPLSQGMVAELLALSRTPGIIRGTCRTFLSPEDIRRLPPEEEEAVRTMSDWAGTERLFDMNGPRLAVQPGPYFSTYFQHPMLTAFLEEKIGDADIDIPVEITSVMSGAGSSQVKIVDSHVNGLDGATLSIPWSAPVGPSIKGESAHDEAFAGRAVRALYELEPEEFTLGNWSDTLASSFSEGVIMLAGVRRITTVIDLERYPLAAGFDLHRNRDASIAWTDLTTATKPLLTLYADEVEELEGYVRQFLRSHFVHPPIHLARRYFPWHRYVRAGR